MPVDRRRVQAQLRCRAAYMFALRHGAWSQGAELTASHGAPGAFFDVSVTLSALGSTALAGAWRHHPDTKAAYVFRAGGA